MRAFSKEIILWQTSNGLLRVFFSKPPIPAEKFLYSKDNRSAQQSRHKTAY
jgi:hypothetical protein